MNLTIRIPGKIDPLLSPNGAHRHWRVKHRAKQDARNAAFVATLVIRPHDERYEHAAFAYDVTIGLAKGEKRKDDDNAAAMTKHYRDGIAAGLGCHDDKGWRLGTVEQVRDPEGVGYLEFRLTQITDESEAA